MAAAETSGRGLGALRSDSGTPLSPLARLGRLAALERQDLGVIAIYAAASGVVSLGVPLAVQSLVNTVAFAALLQPLIVLALLVLVGLLLVGFVRTLQHQVIETLHQRFFVRATHDIAERLVSADLQALPGRKAAELTNRFFDVVVVQKAASALLVDGLTAVLQGALALVLLAFYHPALLAFDLALMSAIAFILFGLGRGGVETAVAESKVKHRTGVWLEQVASELRGFKSAPASAFASARADALARDYVRARSDHFRVLRRQLIASHALQALATSALLGLGGMLVIDQQLTLGQLVAAELAVAGVLASVAKSNKSLEGYYDLVAAVDKVGTLVDLPSERSGPTALARRDGGARVELLDVTCSAAGGLPGPSGVSLSVAPGARLCVLGMESARRAALVDLVCGALVPTRGRVEIDGIDTRHLNLRDWRRDLALVGAAHVIDASVAENLRWGASEAEDAAHTERVLALLELRDGVAALQQGVSTHVAEALPLLGDEAALRLTLARALLSRPRLLLLDGALDALDARAVQRVLGGLESVCPGASLMVFTGREDIAALMGTTLRLDADPAPSVRVAS